MASNKHKVAAQTGDSARRRVLPALVPPKEIAGRALVETPDSGTTDARTSEQVQQKFWTGTFRNGDFAPTGSLEA